MPTPWSLYARDHRTDPDWAGTRSRDPKVGRPIYMIHPARELTAAMLTGSTARMVYAIGPWDGFIARIKRELIGTGWEVSDEASTSQYPDGARIIITRDRPDPVLCGRLDYVAEYIHVWNGGFLFGPYVMGEDCPSCSEVGNAFRRVISILKSHTKNYDDRQIMPKATHADTGIALMATFMVRYTRFERLDVERRDIVWAHQQQRTMVNPRRGAMNEFRYYDHKQFYRSLAHYGHYPTGNFRHYIRPYYDESMQASWVLLTARVPDDWRHVGLVYHDGAWPDAPGTIFRGWFAAPEVRMLHQYGWLQSVEEQLITETQSRCLKPVVDLVNAMSADCDGDQMMLHYFKQLLHAAIGKLHSARTHIREERIIRSKFKRDDHDPDTYRFERGEDGKTYAVITHPITAPENAICAPQLSAHLYALGRARITQALLSIPHRDVVGAYMDAIYTSADQSFQYFSDRDRSCPYVLKGSLSGKYERPKDFGELAKLSSLAADNIMSVNSTEVRHGT